jgi:hypothetical protein
LSVNEFAEKLIVHVAVCTYEATASAMKQHQQASNMKGKNSNRKRVY